MPHDALRWTPYEIGFDLGILSSASDEREAKESLDKGRRVKEEAKKHGRNGDHSKGRNPNRS